MIYTTVGAAVALAVLVAVLKPGAAKGLLNSWQQYKELIFLIIGGLSTYYLLTTGVWYLVLLGGIGVAAGVWAIWFSDWGLGRWTR